ARSPTASPARRTQVRSHCLPRGRDQKNHDRMPEATVTVEAGGTTKSSTPRFSVVVPAYNEEKDLPPFDRYDRRRARELWPARRDRNRRRGQLVYRWHGSRRGGPRLPGCPS